MNLFCVGDHSSPEISPATVEIVSSNYSDITSASFEAVDSVDIISSNDAIINSSFESADSANISSNDATSSFESAISLSKYYLQ